MILFGLVLPRDNDHCSVVVGGCWGGTRMILLICSVGCLWASGRRCCFAFGGVDIVHCSEVVFRSWSDDIVNLFGLPCYCWLL